MNSAADGFVYIHGAGLGTWIWDDLTELQEPAHLSASFPGRGNGQSSQRDLGLQEYVDHVVEQIEGSSIENATVVAHSIGGIVGLEVASELPDSVAGFVGLCAAIPNPGGSFLSCFPFHQRLLQEVLVRLVGTKPPDSVVRSSLCAGLSEEHTNRIVERFEPESRRLFTDERTAPLPDVPTLYVRTTADREMAPSLQDTMIGNLDPDAVATIEAGHMPMLSDPRELAAVLGDFTESRVL